MKVDSNSWLASSSDDNAENFLSDCKLSHENYGLVEIDANLDHIMEVLYPL